MLVSHCSNILGEKIGKRSIQSDIHFLREQNAPIIVNEKKYYTYENKTYSILKTEIPKKLDDQFTECLDFIKEISSFPKYKQQLLSLQKSKRKAEHYVKFLERQLAQAGYFINNAFFSDAELRKIATLIRNHKVADGDSIAKNRILLRTVLTPKLKSLVRKINSHTFLVDATFTLTQHPKEFEQVLNLPFRQRKIPQNLTLWGYPTEEKYEKPNKENLYKHTFAIQVFLKDVTRQTGALQIISGSHQRELSPLEISLIANNTYPMACEVRKGSIVGYKPMLIQRIEESVSPKNKQSITLWFSSYHLPVHYLWNNEINL